MTLSVTDLGDTTRAFNTDATLTLVSTSISVAAGDLLVVQYDASMNNPASQLGLTISCPFVSGGMIELTEAFGDVFGYDHIVGTAYGIITSTGSTTVTLTRTPTASIQWGASFTCYSLHGSVGIPSFLAGQYDKEELFAGTTCTPSLPNTPGFNTFVCVGFIDEFGAPTTPAGWTVALTSSVYGTNVRHLYDNSSAAQSAAFTGCGGSLMLAVMAEFYESTSGITFAIASDQGANDADATAVSSVGWHIASDQGANDSDATATAVDPPIIRQTFASGRSVSADDLLDLNNVNGRAEGMRFDLLDPSGEILGAIHPVQVVTITNDTGGIIKRTISGLELIPSEAADVNPLRHRVRPYWILSDGTEYPMGLFKFVQPNFLRFSYGSHLRGSMCDLGVMLEQPTVNTLSFPVGYRVVDAIRDTIVLAGITDYAIPSSPLTLAAPKVWPAGDSTTYGKIVAELCVMGLFYDGYFDNNGRYQIRASLDPDVNETTLRYLSGGRLVSESMIESNNLMEAPNRYVVLDSAITESPITGVYDIPDSAPQSFANTGLRIPRFVDIPGIGTGVNAIAAARSAYLQDVKAYETVTFAGPPDPRHDTWDLVNYLGTNYLELGWSLKCEPGGEMAHTVRRVFL